MTPSVAWLVKRNRHDDRQRHGDEEMDYRALKGERQRRAHLQVALVIDEFAKSLRFVVLSTEYFDDLLTFNGFLQYLSQHALSTLQATRQATDPTIETTYSHGNERRNCKSNQG